MASDGGWERYEDVSWCQGVKAQEKTSSGDSWSAA
jgi:hypothetical protein